MCSSIKKISENGAAGAAGSDVASSVERRRTQWRRPVVIGMGAALLSFVAAPAGAAVITLTSDDGFTSVGIDPNSVAGMTSMFINGSVNNVQQQGYWFRLGTSGAVSSVSGLTVTSFPAYLGSGSPPPNTYDALTVNYTGTYAPSAGHSASFDIQIQYIMNDGGSTQGNVSEQVSVSTTGASNVALPIELFEYNHFTPLGDATNEQAAINPFDGILGSSYNDATQNNVLTDATVAEDLVTPGPDFYQVGTFSDPTTYFTGLTGNLPGDSSVVLGGAPTSGVGDVQWIFQWNDTGVNSIAPGQTGTVISKLLTVTVPEPAVASMAMCATGLWALRRPRRKLATELAG